MIKTSLTEVLWLFKEFVVYLLMSVKYRVVRERELKWFAFGEQEQ
jgi:hypothetical protein